jgi:hypothetical protein
MIRFHITTRSLAVAPALALVCASLAACGEQEKTYETRTEDLSGGEFIVTEADREGVEVELPQTPMTPVPPEGATPTAGAETMEDSE